MSIVANTPTGFGSLSSDRKRKDSEEDEQGTSSMQPHKRARSQSPMCYYRVILDSESPLPTDEDEESVYSFQGNETAYVRDTSDTSSHWGSSDEDESHETFRIEYEVAPPSDHETGFMGNLSSSDPEDIIAVGVIAAMCDSDLGLADNSDDSRSSVDSEIGKADYWTCVQCNTDNNNPMFRYCEKCYKERKNFFPPRPKRKRRSCPRKKLEEAPIEVQQSEPLPDISKAMDSGLGSSQESSQNSDNLCVMCATNPKDGVFVHGTISHICCCYKCAVKVWRTNSRCPICKIKVSKVLKAFYT